MNIIFCICLDKPVCSGAACYSCRFSYTIFDSIVMVERCALNCSRMKGRKIKTQLLYSKERKMYGRAYGEPLPCQLPSIFKTKSNPRIRRNFFFFIRMKTKLERGEKNHSNDTTEMTLMEVATYGGPYLA